MQDFYRFLLFFVATFIFGFFWGYVIFGIRERHLLDDVYRAWCNSESTVGLDAMELHERYESIRGEVRND